MLDNISKSQTYSILTSSVTATDTNFVDTGLALYLAPNTAYRITFIGYCSWDTDGARYKFVYTGALVHDDLYVTKEDGTPSKTTVGTAIPEITSTVEVIKSEGLLVTSTGGTLYVQLAKYFDFGVDTSILEGSHLIATPL